MLVTTLAATIYQPKKIRRFVPVFSVAWVSIMPRSVRVRLGIF